MPKSISDDIDEQVLAHIWNSPEGIGIEALSNLLGGLLL